MKATPRFTWLLAGVAGIWIGDLVADFFMSEFASCQSFVHAHPWVTAFTVVALAGSVYDTFFAHAPAPPAAATDAQHQAAPQGHEDLL
jgi:hypothetical protein